MPVTGGTGASYQEQLMQALYGGQSQAIGQAGLTGAAAEAQAAQAPAALGAGAQNLASQYGYTLAGLGNEYQGVGLQQALQGIESGTAAQQQGFEQQTYGLQQQQLALDPQSIALQNALLGTQEGVATGTEKLQQGSGGVGGGGYAAQLANLAYQEPLAQQAQAGQAASAGASNTVGNKQAQQTIGEQYAYNVGNVQNQAQQSQFGLPGPDGGLPGAGGAEQAQPPERLPPAADRRSQPGLRGGRVPRPAGAVPERHRPTGQHRPGPRHLRSAGLRADGIRALPVGVSNDSTAQIIQAAQGQTGQSQGYAQLLQAAGAIGGLGPNVGY